ncbi:MAG: hypothetical protein F6J93_04160 [Oscillatoria sp. SIO1A7]|nr:hypothetical protein [Oscillatoria sp. SIO1A7]
MLLLSSLEVLGLFLFLESKNQAIASIPAETKRNSRNFTQGNPGSDPDDLLAPEE